ncbi:MAG: hypothetical protein ING19_21650 [Azospirillum sp.]|nr:hypothetical protein [Azospirillum sp.]
MSDASSNPKTKLPKRPGRYVGQATYDGKRPLRVSERIRAKLTILASEERKNGRIPDVDRLLQEIEATEAKIAEVREPKA